MATSKRRSSKPRSRKRPTTLAKQVPSRFESWDLLNSLFIGPVAFFAILILRKIYPLTPINLGMSIGLVLAVALMFAITTFRKGWAVGLLGVILAVIFYAMAISGIEYMSTFAFSFLMLGTAYSWHSLLMGRTTKETAEKLGVKTNNILRDVAAGLLATILIIYPVIIIEGAIFTLAGMNDVGRVNELMGDAPWYVSVFAFTVAPFTEEFFFRALLVPALGVLPSAFFFSIAHYAYNSVVEFAGALTLGIAFGYIYKKTGSVFSVVAAHALFNFTSVALMYLSKIIS